jgi:hypothetical protein
MIFRRLILVFLAFGLLVGACSGDSQEISADTCRDVIDETMELFQRLIDDVDAEFGEMTVEEFIATEGDLPSIDRFTEDAAKINQIGTQLGCSQGEIQQSVLQRVDELTASTDLGRFLITSIRTGGL